MLAYFSETNLQYLELVSTIFVYLIIVFVVILYIYCNICRAKINIALSCNNSNKLEYYSVRSTCKRVEAEYGESIRFIRDLIIYCILVYLLLRTVIYVLKDNTIKIDDITILLLFLMIIFYNIYCNDSDERNEYELLRNLFNNGGVEVDKAATETKTKLKSAVILAAVAAEKTVAATPLKEEATPAARGGTTKTELENGILDNEFKCMKDDILQNIKYVHGTTNGEAIYQTERLKQNLFDYIVPMNLSQYPCFINSIFVNYNNMIESNNIDFGNYANDINYKIMRGYTDSLYGEWIFNDYHMIDLISILLIIFIYIILHRILPYIGYMPLLVFTVTIVLVSIYFFDIIYKVRKS